MEQPETTADTVTVNFRMATSSVNAGHSMLPALCSKAGPGTMSKSEMKRPRGFACNVCGGSFSRREHLQRHLLMHGSHRPFACKFCSQNFGRRDVLKRHMHVCKARVEAGVGMPDIPQRSRGKKRTACYRCGTRKIACSATYPCNACVKSNSCCEFERQPRSPSPRIQDMREQKSVGDITLAHDPPTVTPPADNHSLSSISLEDHVDGGVSSTESDGTNNVETKESPAKEVEYSGMMIDYESIFRQGLDPAFFCQNLNSTPPTQIHSGTRDLFAFRFLKQSTMALGLANSFECGTLAERQALLERFSGPQPMSHIENLIPQSDSHDVDDKMPPNCHPTPTTTAPNDQGSRFPSTSFLERDLPGDLHSVTDAIVSAIREVIVHKPLGSKVTMSWSPSVEASCSSFFSAQNLQQNLGFYWSCWYPNFPVMHEPTFSAVETSPALLAAMSIIGACLCPRSTDRANANMWFSVLEELAFGDPILLDNTISVQDGKLGDRKAVRRRLEATQAAYLVCVFQNWEGSKDSRLRVRYQGYATLLAVARGFGLNSVTRNHLPVQQLSDFSWSDFILLEELIRIGQYIFLLESAFVVFHNLPPRLIVPEMKLSLAAPEECFQATSAEQCFVLFHPWVLDNPEQSRMQTYHAVKLLCNIDNDDNDERLKPLSQLSVLNLFVLISALHCITFHLHSSMSSLSQFSPIRSGLDRWIQLWTQQKPDNLDSSGSIQDMWRRPGFMKHSAEYWLLTQTIVDRITPQAMMPYAIDPSMTQTMPQASFNTHSCGALLAGENNRVYDDNEMDSLKAIIDGFRAIT